MKLAKPIGMSKANVPRHETPRSLLHSSGSSTLLTGISEESLILVVSSRSGQPGQRFLAERAVTTSFMGVAAPHSGAEPDASAPSITIRRCANSISDSKSRSGRTQRLAESSALAERNQKY